MSESLKPLRQRLHPRVLVTVLAVAAALAACGDDDPTSVGAPLFPEGLVHTFEVVLDADEFAVMDTALGGFLQPWASGRLLVADQFEGVLDANTVLRLAALPATVTYRDTAGQNQVDTLPQFFEGAVVLYLDSMQIGTSPATLALDVLAERWHPRTATWELRADTAGVQTPWQQPGGTPAERVGTGTWTADADSVVFPVDSARLAEWSDTTVLAAGLRISAQTAGTRLSATRALLRIKARPSPRPDTVIDVTVTASDFTFLFDPPPPAATGLNVGGVPTWRSMMELRDRLDTLTVEFERCAAGGSCQTFTIRLSDATVTRAELLLQPLPPPPGFRPADTVRVEMRPALRTPLVPIERSPLTEPVTPFIAVGVDPAAFTLPLGAAPRLALPFTSYVRNAVAPPDSATVEAVTQPTLALLPEVPGSTFGFAVFGDLESGAHAPRLRLVLTVSEEVLRP